METRGPSSRRRRMHPLLMLPVTQDPLGLRSEVLALAPKEISRRSPTTIHASTRGCYAQGFHATVRDHRWEKSRRKQVHYELCAPLAQSLAHHVAQENQEERISLPKLAGTSARVSRLRRFAFPAIVEQNQAQHGVLCQVLMRQRLRKTQR
jgi:hypothetical protein